MWSKLWSSSQATATMTRQRLAMKGEAIGFWNLHVADLPGLSGRRYHDSRWHHLGLMPQPQKRCSFLRNLMQRGMTDRYWYIYIYIHIHIHIHIHIYIYWFTCASMWKPTNIRHECLKLIQGSAGTPCLKPCGSFDMGPLGFALGGQGSGRIAEAAGSTTIWVSWAGTGR